MRLLHCVFLGLAVACSVTGQTYTISTYAGGLPEGLPVAPPVNIPGTSASVPVNQVAVDGEGNVFFTTKCAVLRLDVITGILTLAAGNGTVVSAGTTVWPRAPTIEFLGHRRGLRRQPLHRRLR